jgi:ABC-type glycerol-3-phosphate transport system permease component
MYTVTVFIANQIGYRTSTDWTVVMPAGLLLTIPSIIVAVYFQQHFVKGMMAGSTK